MNTVKCNICGCPRVVSYNEYDAETGHIRVQHHTVECLGHLGVHPQFWNRAKPNSTGQVRSLGYEDYQKLFKAYAKDRPNVEKKTEGIEDLRVRQEAKRQKRLRKSRAKLAKKKRGYQVRGRKNGRVRQNNRKR